MERHTFCKPVVRKGKEKVESIVCKRAICSGSSTHSNTKYKSATIIETKKAS